MREKVHINEKDDKGAMRCLQQGRHVQIRLATLSRQGLFFASNHSWLCTLLLAMWCNRLWITRHQLYFSRTVFCYQKVASRLAVTRYVYKVHGVAPEAETEVAALKAQIAQLQERERLLEASFLFTRTLAEDQGSAS